MVTPFLLLVQVPPVWLLWSGHPALSIHKHVYPLLVVYTSGFGPPLHLGAPSLGPVWVSLGLDTPGPDTPSLGTIGLVTPGLGTPGLVTPSLGTPGLDTSGLGTASLGIPCQVWVSLVWVFMSDNA